MDLIVICRTPYGDLTVRLMIRLLSSLISNNFATENYFNLTLERLSDIAELS
jgi:hypothetical protein